MIRYSQFAGFIFAGVFLTAQEIGNTSYFDNHLNGHLDSNNSLWFLSNQSRLLTFVKGASVTLPCQVSGSARYNKKVHENVLNLVKSDTNGRRTALGLIQTATMAEFSNSRTLELWFFDPLLTATRASINALLATNMGPQYPTKQTCVRHVSTGLNSFSAFF